MATTTKQKGRDSGKSATPTTSSHDTALTLNSIKEEPRADSHDFSCSVSPRHLRAIFGLLRHPISREELDRVAGCSNSPQLVAELRRRGLDVPCRMLSGRDRDGRTVRYGEYRLTGEDRRKVMDWFRESSLGARAAKFQEGA